MQKENLFFFCISESPSCRPLFVLILPSTLSFKHLFRFLYLSWLLQREGQQRLRRWATEAPLQNSCNNFSESSNNFLNSCNSFLKSCNSFFERSIVLHRHAAYFAMLQRHRARRKGHSPGRICRPSNRTKDMSYFLNLTVVTGRRASP